MGIIYNADDQVQAGFDPELAGLNRLEFLKRMAQQEQPQAVPQAQAPSYNPYPVPFVPRNYISNYGVRPGNFSGLQPSGYNQFGRPVFDATGLLNNASKGLLAGESNG